MTNETASNSPLEPIVLNPGTDQTQSSISTQNVKRGFFSTFGILLAGWFFGNLILMAVVSLIAITVVGSTGLISVPLLSDYLFGKPQKLQTNLNSESLIQAEKKVATINDLKDGQTLDEVIIYEDEANALLSNQFTRDKNFPTTNEHLSFEDDKFIFTAKLAQTNAPVRILGKVDNNSTTASIQIISAQFGKIEIPGFIAGNIIDSNLGRVGLTLSGSQVPAKDISIKDGALILKQVIKVQNQ